MLTIQLTPEVRAVLIGACKRSGIRETGGMLFGEHVSEEAFRVVEVTVAGTGSVASFVRGVLDSLRQLDRFFHRTKRDYRRFNYLGEWHSHPSFALYPSSTDDSTMFDILNDPGTGARFAVSIIVRLEGDDLAAQAFTYFPGTVREDASVVQL